MAGGHVHLPDMHTCVDREAQEKCIREGGVPHDEGEIMCMLAHLEPRFVAQRLSGHVSGVESVHFDGAEEVVVAGSVSGTLKLWDLATGKSS